MGWLDLAVLTIDGDDWPAKADRTSLGERVMIAVGLNQTRAAGLEKILTQRSVEGNPFSDTLIIATLDLGLPAEGNLAVSARDALRNLYPTLTALSHVIPMRQPNSQEEYLKAACAIVEERMPNKTDAEIHTIATAMVKKLSESRAQITNDALVVTLAALH